MHNYSNQLPHILTFILFRGDNLTGNKKKMSIKSHTIDQNMKQKLPCSYLVWSGFGCKNHEQRA